MRRLPLTMLASMALLAVLFTVWPQLDLMTSGLFFHRGIGFVGDRDAIVMAMYKGVPAMSRAVIIGLFIALFAYSFQRGTTGARRRVQVLYLIAVLALGPGLVVDVALKGHWGRARPTMIHQFGGERSFTPALQPADQCDGNCSFVSGHAAAGFYLVALGFVGGPAARRRWLVAALAAGGFMGLGRIAQGGHFLSDVVFSFYAVWLSAWLMWRVFVRFGWLADEAPADSRAPALAVGR